LTRKPKLKISARAKQAAVKYPDSHGHLQSMITYLVIYFFPVQNEHIFDTAQPKSSGDLDRYRTSPPTPDVGTVSASRDTIVSGRPAADGIGMAIVQLSSVGRLGMTYILLPTTDSSQTYRIAGRWRLILLLLYCIETSTALHCYGLCLHTKHV